MTDMIYLREWLQESGFLRKSIVVFGGFEQEAWDRGHVRVLIEDAEAADIRLIVFEPGRARIVDWDARFDNAPASPVLIPTIQLALGTVRT